MSGKVLIGAVTAVVVILAVWGYRQLEWEERVVDEGFSSLARHNPFLAAQRFLRSQGVETKHYTSVLAVDTLPLSADATVVLAGSRQALGVRRAEWLWQWVESGGHLVIDAQGYTDPGSGESSDVLLEWLGLGHYSKSADDHGLDDEDAVLEMLMNMAGQWRSDCEGGEALVDFRLGDDPEPVQAHIRGDGWLMDADDLALASAGSHDEGAQFVQFEVGDGLVSVFTDLSHWSNRYVECHDHAFLLWYLVGSNPQAWFVYSSELPSLAGLLWRQAPLVVVLSGSVLALWLWRRGRRFGPVLVSDVRTRRSLIEHLHASALFMWRNGQWIRLLEALRVSIRRSMAARHPGFRHLNTAEQYALIARLTDIDEQQVAWALGAESLSDRRHFVKAVQLLQTIRNAL